MKSKKITKRLALPAVLALGSAFPVTAQGNEAEQLRQVISQIEEKLAERRAEIEAMENQPVEEGTERAAQDRLRQLQEQRNQIQESANAQAEEAGDIFEAIAREVYDDSEQWTGSTEERDLPGGAEDLNLDDIAGSSEPEEADSPTLEGSGDIPVMTSEAEGADTESDGEIAMDDIQETSPPVTEPNREEGIETTEPGPAIVELPDKPMEVEGLARRILSRPDTKLYEDPNGDSATVDLPTFSILYVFAEHDTDTAKWLAVGETRQNVDGWVLAEKAQEWRTMLVMKYAPKGNRGRVVFFDEPGSVHDIIERRSLFREQMVDDLYSSIKERTYNPERITAIEPQTAVQAEDRPYLMPILDHQQGYFDSGEQTQILQLAAVNLAEDQLPDQQASSGEMPADIDSSGSVSEEQISDFRVGMAFVIDTTTSMGPYLDRAKEFVRQVRTETQERGIEDKFDVALVGFRDNTSPNEDIEYVTRTYRDFGDTEPLGTQIDSMAPAATPTENWREDAFAGLQDAISGLSWGDVDTRIIFLVTDASPRSVGDSLARNSSIGPQAISALAQAANSSIMIAHMQTPQAREVSQSTDGVDDTARGQHLYSQLRGQGVGGLGNYFRLTGDTAEDFGRELQRTAERLVAALDQSSSGQTIDDIGSENSVVLSEELQALSDDGSGIEVSGDRGANLIASAVLSELFRYQQEYLGAESGTEAPAFYRAWAADIDLVNPGTPALEVSVFMTRSQLGSLAQQLNMIISSLEAKESGLGEFFGRVQQESGRAAVDPSIGDVLPSYLDGLPYGSKFINLTPEIWESMSPSSKGALLDEVKQKVAFYIRVNSSENGWLRVSDRSGADEVFPLPLSQLP